MFNVGVPDVDENVEAGWWRKTVDGGEFDVVEPVRFPDLNDDVDIVGVTTHQLEVLALVEDSSDDEDEGEDDGHGGDGGDDSWGPDDDALEHEIRVAKSGGGHRREESLGTTTKRIEVCHHFGSLRPILQVQRMWGRNKILN